MSKDKSSVSDLHTALRADDVESVEKLLKNGSNPSEKISNNEGWSSNSYTLIHIPLRTAERYSYKEATPNLKLASMLLEYGADVNGVYSQGGWRISAIHATAFQEILLLTFKNPSKESYNLLKLSLEKGGDPNNSQKKAHESMRTDSSRSTTLLTTALSNPRIVQILLNANANPNAYNTYSLDSEYGTRERTKSTPLHHVIEDKPFNEISMLLLLHYGADVDKKKEYIVQRKRPKPESAIGITNPRQIGYDSGLDSLNALATPLHLAIKSKDVRRVLILRMFAADVNIPFSCGDEISSCMDLVDEYMGTNSEEDSKLRLLMTLALNQRWHPRLHPYFPKVFRDQVFFLMLCINRCIESYIPREVLQYIIYTAADEECFSPELIFNLDTIFDVNEKEQK